MRLLATAIACIGLAGCLSSGTYVPVQHYTIAPQVDLARAKGSGSGALAVRPLDYARFYKQPMVYRDENLQVEYYDSASWAELPRDAVTRVLLDALIQTGHFRDVAYALDISRPDYILQGELRRFDEDRRSNGAVAVVEARFELREANSDDVAWSDTLRAETPVEANSPQALAQAMSESVAMVIEEAVEAINSNVP